jgi:hypothetical protein
MLLPFLAVAVLCSLPFAADILADRQRDIVVCGLLNVYKNPEPYWRAEDNEVVATVDEFDAVKVRRIRYGKDFMVIKVELSGGRNGYVFYGDDFELF